MPSRQRAGDRRRLALRETAGGAEAHARLGRRGGDRLGRRLREQQQVARLEPMPRHADLLPFDALRAQGLHQFLASARDARDFREPPQMVFAEAAQREVAEIVVHQVQERLARPGHGRALRGEVLPEPLVARTRRERAHLAVRQRELPPRMVDAAVRRGHHLVADEDPVRRDLPPELADPAAQRGVALRVQHAVDAHLVARTAHHETRDAAAPLHFAQCVRDCVRVAVERIQAVGRHRSAHVLRRRRHDAPREEERRREELCNSVHWEFSVRMGVSSS